MPEEKISFIPKKTFEAPEAVSAGPGFLVSFGAVILVLSGLAFGATYFYRSALVKNRNGLAESLKRARDAFDPALINQFISTSSKIKEAKLVMENHQDLLPLFDLINNSTLKNVRFTNFDYSITKNDGPFLTMKGEAPSYADLAIQADQFEKNENIKSVLFSGLSLGDKGQVLFTVKMMIGQPFIIYKAERQ
ncbi:MAG TPA: hypothetical protein VJJ73_01785 [Candidatus Paceibacterota bacterium]